MNEVTPKVMMNDKPVRRDEFDEVNKTTG